MNYSFNGLDHVQLAAPEGCEAKARLFFNKLLGWAELEKPEPLKPRGGAWFQCGIHEVHVGVQSDFVAATKAHPAFHVQGLSQLRTYLLKNDVPVIDDEARAEEGITRFYIHDPFGNRLEFLERSH
ncbi:glyoxalase [Paenibacillus turicensis]|uniref:glyoxalase n=1 Tax=Paenibacillus turicensis TaxID=160487 RepID=UPI003D2D94FC